MPDIPKGGRGHKASYETTHARIPVALKVLVQRLSDDYKVNGLTPDNEAAIFPPLKLQKMQAIQLAVQILKSKKNAKTSMEKLLTGLYGVDVIID
jgi:hypothetical protein